MIYQGPLYGTAWLFRVEGPELLYQDLWLREFQQGFHHLSAVTFMLPVQVKMFQNIFTQKGISFKDSLAAQVSEVF